MNRNESFLVYGMFALLALIVLVALLFGGDPASAKGGEDSSGGKANDPASLVQNSPAGEGSVEGVRQLDELPGMDPSRGLGNVDDPASIVRGADRNPGGSPPNADLVADRNGAAGAGSLVGADTPDDSDLLANSGARANSGAVGDSNDLVGSGTGVPGPASAGANALGDRVADAGLNAAYGPGSGPAGTHSLSRSVGAAPRSTRIGNYREVAVARGDTFSTLVVRWCGSLDAMGVAAALNETVNLESLRAGTKIVLPWVADEILAEKQRDRKARSVLSDVAAGKTYTVRSGDSLWVIARRQVDSSRQVPGYIQQILTANPRVDADRLQVGAKLVMP